MTAMQTLRLAAADGEVWGASPPADAATIMAEQLEGLLAVERFTAHQRDELAGLLEALRTLADRLEVV